VPVIFDPDRVAYLETAGWRAYYDHHWPDLLRLMLSLNRGRIPAWPTIHHAQPSSRSISPPDFPRSPMWTT
jgi:hypothetical protein